MLAVALTGSAAGVEVLAKACAVSAAAVAAVAAVVAVALLLPNEELVGADRDAKVAAAAAEVAVAFVPADNTPALPSYFSPKSSKLVSGLDLKDWKLRQSQALERMTTQA